MKEARYYTADGENVACHLCPHNCHIKNGKAGICGVRINTGGTLFTAIYGELTALAMDPIEKKPLYHFFPGSSILSIGTKGCNLKCPYCQNWHISQDTDVSSNSYTPEEVVNAALRNDSVGIAYTYSEPVIWFEYVMDCAALARKKGLKNVLVTNGFINPDPLEDLLEYTDAMNIDLKSFRKETYVKIQKAKLDNVLETIKSAYKRCHIEITTLIVTGINDTMEEMKEIINWIYDLDRNIPWHISRYYPSYRYDASPTDIDFIFKVREEATKRLNFVYCGNVPADGTGSNTLCPACGSVVIFRSGYRTQVTDLKNGTCGTCGHDLKIPQ